MIAKTSAYEYAIYMMGGGVEIYVYTEVWMTEIGGKRWIYPILCTVPTIILLRLLC